MRVNVKKIGPHTREIQVDGKPVVCISEQLDTLSKTGLHYYEIQPDPTQRVVVENSMLQTSTARGTSHTVFERKHL